MKASHRSASVLCISLFTAVSLLLVACGGDSDSDETGGTGGVGATGGTGGSGGVGATGGTGGSGGAAGSNTGGFGAGGPCTYKDIVGKATIMEITPINGSVCPDPQIAMYDFAADDTTIPADSYDPTKYGMNASFESISLAGGKGLPKSCLDPSGIKLNAVFPMTRRIIQTGTCTPVIDVLTLDLSLCESQCP